MLWLKRILAILAVLVLGWLSLLGSEKGFQQVLDFRMLERIPLTTIMGSTGGESQLKGRAFKVDRLLSSPRTDTDCVYYRYKVEEEYRDSDGDRHWRTIRDETRVVDFYLEDASDRAVVNAERSRGTIDWSVEQKYRKQVGDMRYTEWRIDEIDEITLYGWLDKKGSEAVVRFDRDGAYLPIVSSFSGTDERSDISAMAILWLWLGVSLMVLMCFAVIYALRWHKLLIFLSLVTVSTFFLLLSYSIKSLESDVEAGFERVNAQRQQARELIADKLAEYGLEFPGWDSGFDLESNDYYALSDEDRAQINSWRNLSYQIRQRYLQQIDRFPDNLYAKSRRMAKPQAIILPADQQAIADDALQHYQPTKVGKQLLLTCLALLLTAIMAWLAWRLIRFKRMQENLPTSKTSGAVFGLIELAGKLKPEDDKECFKGPVSNRDCIWYHYVIKEKRGSGKNSRWVTIHDETRKQPFYCEDDEGEIRVFPSKAEIITRHSCKNREWRKRYYEKRLEPGDALYLIGKAKPDKTTGDTLVLSHEKDSPFLIANRSESEVMFIKASKAMLLLCAGISLLFGAGLWIAGSNGNFSSVDFLMAAMIGPLFLFMLMIAIMYNDMVFLRNRCDRNWSNIQVSLQKRATLIPQLQRVVQKYLQHEKELQQSLTRMRQMQSGAQSKEDVDRYMAEEFRFIEKLNLRMEQYPELKANEVMQDFQRRLIKLENEIAMIRSGFNDAVLYYNTRVQLFPDNLLAKIFGFKKLDFLAFDKKAHKVPKVDMKQAPADPA